MSAIPSLTAGSIPDGTEKIHVVQGGNSRRLTLTQVLAILHTHAISDVTDLQAALDAKLDDSQAGAGGLAVLGAADAAAVRAAADVYSTGQVDSAIATAVTGLLEYKGATDCSANPNYPAAAKGDAYVVSVAGKIGGASGTSVDAGDVFFATADNAGGTQASVGSSWASIEHNGIFGGSVSFASAAEIQAGSNSTKAIAADQLAAAAAPQTLTDGATISWDMSQGYNAKVTLGGNRTLAVSNPVVGWTYCLGVIQDGTGSRTLTWPASFDWGTTGAPTLTTTASKRDRITLFCTDAATPKFDAFLSGKGFS